MNNQNKDLFARASEGIENAKIRTKNLFSNYLTYILFFILIIAQIVFEVFVFEKKGLSSDLWIPLLISMASNCIAFWLFISQGKKNEIKSNSSYNDNCINWSLLSGNVQNNRPREFNVHCKEETENKRISILESYLRNALIEEDTWILLRSLTNKEFKRKMKEKNENGRIYTRNQIGWLKKARKPIKVKPIDPCLILTGASYEKGGEVGVAENISYESRMTIQRVATMGLFTILINLIGVSFYQGFNANTIAECIIRVFGIATSAVMGFYTGVTAIQIKNSKIKKNINFIKTFFNGKENSKGEEH